MDRLARHLRNQGNMHLNIVHPGINTGGQTLAGMLFSPTFSAVAKLQSAVHIDKTQTSVFNDTAMRCRKGYGTDKALMLARTGRWASSLHWKQKVAPQRQVMSMGSLPTSVRASTACSHPGLGHHAICLIRHHTPQTD